METLNELKKCYKYFMNLKLNLDMTRGKPCHKQLDLSDALLTNLNVNDLKYI